MNLKEEILRRHSKEQTDLIVRWIGSDKKRFGDLMKLFMGDDYRITQRASWAVTNCLEKHPMLATPYYKKLLDHLNKPGTHEAVARYHALFPVH